MSLKEWNVIISYASDFSDGIPLLLFIFLFHGRPATEWRMLQVYYCISFPLKMITIYMSQYRLNTMPFYHLLAILELTLFSITYIRLLKPNTQRYYYGLVAMLSFNVFNSIWLQDISSFNSNAWTLNCLFLLALGLIYLFTLYQRIEEIRLEQHSGFIFNAAILVYCAGSLFFFLLSFSIFSHEAEGFYYNGWIIQSVANILKNVIITFALWKARLPLMTHSS